jgi:hypothetical protein
VAGAIGRALVSANDDFRERIDRQRVLLIELVLDVTQRRRSGSWLAPELTSWGVSRERRSPLGQDCLACLPQLIETST